MIKIFEEFTGQEKFGWLDREGKFYECERGGHDSKAIELGHTTTDLEDMGWVRLTKGYAVMGPDYKHGPSLEQVEFVYAWCMKNRELRAWDEFRMLCMRKMKY
jgi:hypothetical protein